MKNVPIITNFTEYFRTERDVYVQNRSNTQVSMQFETFPGRIESVLLLIAGGGEGPADLAVLRADGAFARLVGHGWPSPSAGRK